MHFTAFAMSPTSKIKSRLIYSEIFLVMLQIKHCSDWKKNKKWNRSSISLFIPLINKSQLLHDIIHPPGSDIILEGKHHLLDLNNSVMFCCICSFVDPISPSKNNDKTFIYAYSKSITDPHLTNKNSYLMTSSSRNKWHHFGGKTPPATLNI